MCDIFVLTCDFYTPSELISVGEYFCSVCFDNFCNEKLLAPMSTAIEWF